MPTSFNFKTIKWVNQRINDLKDWNDWKVISLSHAFYCTQTHRISKILLPLFTTCHATVALYTVIYITKLLFHTYIFWLSVSVEALNLLLKGSTSQFLLLYFKFAFKKKKKIAEGVTWKWVFLLDWIKNRGPRLLPRFYLTQGWCEKYLTIYKMATTDQECHSA